MDSISALFLALSPLRWSAHVFHQTLAVGSTLFTEHCSLGTEH